MNVKTLESAADFADDNGGHKGALGAISAWFAAMNEGITLAGRYKELTARGVAPDAAVRRVFDQIKR